MYNAYSDNNVVEVRKMSTSKLTSRSEQWVEHGLTTKLNVAEEKKKCTFASHVPSDPGQVQQMQMACGKR